MRKTIPQLRAWLRVPQHFILMVIALMPVYMVLLYIGTYGRHVPVNDQWFEPLGIAAAVQNGTFTLDLITRETYGHRSVFSYGLTALLSYTTHWDVMLEIYVGFALAILRFALIVLIFRECAPQLTHLALVPFSLLIFSTYQYLVWLSGIYSVWHFVSLFLLTTIWILVRYPVGWRPLVGAAFFAACAAFSQGSGALVFPVLTLTLWMFGYRRWTYYAFWVGMMILALGLYFSAGDSGGVLDDAGDKLQQVSVGMRFIFAYLGNPFTHHLDTDLPVSIGRVGVLMVAANIFYLWRRERDPRRLAAWVSLTLFTGAVAFSIYLSRYTESRFIYSIEQRYALISTHLWLAYTATAILVCWRIWHTERDNLLPGILLTFNVIFAVLLTVLFLQATVWNMQVTAYRYNDPLDSRTVIENEDTCIRDFPPRRDLTCVKETYAVQIGSATPEAIYQLAVHRLTVFADAQPVFVLPDSYHAGSPIVIDSPSRWLNAYIREWMLAGVDEANLFHIAPPPEQIPIDDLREPLTDVHDTFSETALSAFIDQAEQVWYIRTSETESHEAAVTAFLESRGYVALYIPIQNERYRDADFTVIRYLLAPQDTQDLYFFGDDIALQAFKLDGDSLVSACQTVTLQSWWTVYDVPDRNYSATLILVNAAGEKVTQQDGALAGIEMGVWIPDLLYLDERALSLPCDLPPGEYELQFGIYDFETFEELPVTDNSGVDSGFRASVLTLRIR